MYATGAVFLVGRIIFYVVYDYQSKGVGGLIAYGVVVVAITPLVVLIVRRGRARRRR